MKRIALVGVTGYGGVHCGAGGGDASNLCSLAMARAQVRAVELMNGMLPVTLLNHFTVRRDDGQWIVPRLPEAFDTIWRTGRLEFPDFAVI